jgi:uncharacterized protein
MLQSPFICVKESPGRGRGVFAAMPIRKGAVVERVPVLLVPLKDLVGGKMNPTLNTYLYQWTKKHFACCLGYGSLYNHSFEPNLSFKYGRNTMTYKALRFIEVGEELTINYNGDPKDKTPVDFDVV